MSRPDALFNLADALTEDILNTPDDDLLREVEEDYGDPRALANKFDEILERAEKQVFGTARSAAPILGWPYRLLEWFSTVFGSGPGRSGTPFRLSSVNGTVWVGAAAVLIVLILGPAVFLSISEFNERSGQLAALEKEQLARSEQLAAQEKELLARSEQLAAQEKELLARYPVAAATAPAAETPASGQAAERLSIMSSEPRNLCENRPASFERLICADDDVAFWRTLVSEIYQHRWRHLDTKSQQILHQGQLDWLRNIRRDCIRDRTNTWTPEQMADAKSCVIQSTKKRVVVLSNN